MTRLRYNGLTATLGAALASGDTTVTFAAALTSAAGAVPTLSGGDTIALSILDAGGDVAEIVSLTAYTSGATTGTIARAQESTTATAHASGATVVHAATAADFASSGWRPGLTPASPTYPFDGTALPTGVTAVGYTSGYSVHDGILEVTTGLAAGNYFYVPAPAGDWTAVARMFTYAEGSTMFGLMGLDGSGNGMAAGWYNSNPNGPFAASISGGAYNNSFTAVSPARPMGSDIETGIPCWYRLRKVGTTYYASLSPNGEAWTAEASLTGGPSTATRIAVGSFYLTVQRWAVDFIDIT